MAPASPILQSFKIRWGVCVCVWSGEGNEVRRVKGWCDCPTPRVDNPAKARKGGGEERGISRHQHRGRGEGVG
eukprot:scaffold22730_cov39-Isochrysis_galbana.AAC.1